MESYLIPTIQDVKAGDGKVENPEAMLSAGPAVTRIVHTVGGVSPSLTLDFGRKTTGWLTLEITEGSFDSILLEYGPLLSSLHVRKVLRMPAPGRPWVDEHYIACRYVRLSLLSEANQPSRTYLSIRRIGLVFSAYPCVWRGSFSSGDAMLDRIWETGAYTVQLCVQKSSESSTFNFHLLPEANKRFIKEWKGHYSPYVIFDGPRRDRETWLGDIRTEALAIYGAFGADEVVKSSLEVFLDLQRNDGLTVGCGATWQEFKEYNLWWIIAIWECYLFTGDEAFLQRFLPGVKRFLGWLEFAKDERGFLDNDGNWMWTIPREGFSSATQCILVETLRCAARILAAAGDATEAEVLIRNAEALRMEIRKTWWNEEKGIFDDAMKLYDTEIPVVSDVNCYAVTFGIADAEQSRRILAYLRERMWTPYGSATLDKKIVSARLSPDVKSYGLANFVRQDAHPELKIVEFMYPHNRMIWPFMVAYEVEARFIAGDTEGAFELIRRCWGNMLEGGTGTFWECVDADTGTFPLRSFNVDSKIDCVNSAAHGWSGWITWILQAHVLGVRPLEPGYRKVLVSPNPGALPKVSGTVPTPHGPVTATIISTATELRIEVSAPAGVEVVVDVRPSVLSGRRLVV
jgi:hypothetical protein